MSEDMLSPELEAMVSEALPCDENHNSIGFLAMDCVCHRRPAVRELVRRVAEECERLKEIEARNATLKASANVAWQSNAEALGVVLAALGDAPYNGEPLARWVLVLVRERDALRARIANEEEKLIRLAAHAAVLEQKTVHHDALAAKHARLVEAARAILNEIDGVQSPALGTVNRLRDALLRDEPETPKGNAEVIRGDPTYFSGVPGCNPPSHAHSCTCPKGEEK